MQLHAHPITAGCLVFDVPVTSSPKPTSSTQESVFVLSKNRNTEYKALVFTMPSSISQLPAYILSFEHFLGGQARITSLLTPSLYQGAVVRKGPGTAEALYPIIPFRDPTIHSNFIGVLMLLQGTLLAYPPTRGSFWTLGLNTFLTAAGIYSQRRMGIPYWLPCVNMALGFIVWWTRNQSQL